MLMPKREEGNRSRMVMDRELIQERVGVERLPGGKLFKTRMALLLTLLLAPAFQMTLVASPPSREIPPLRWLIAGPVPVSGDNALFADYLSASGGEGRMRARIGEVAANRPEGPVRWQASSPDQDGLIDFTKVWPREGRAIAYAYAELEADVERYVVATIGSGNNIQVRLNGEVVYENRLSRKPAPDKDTLVLRLRKGVNPLLVKVEGGSSYWKLQWSIQEPSGRVFVNRRVTIMPDFRIGERTGAWGQVKAANVSGTVLTGVRVELLGDDLVLPSRSAAIILAPGEVQRIPFWVAAKNVTPEGASPQIRLRVTADGEVQSFELTPCVRKPTEYFVTTYRSAVDGSVQPYSVLLPTSYQPDIAYPLIVLLHGAHVTDWGQNIISYEPKEWAIQVAVHDRGNNRYRDIGEVDLYEALMDVQRRYRIDPERLYLSGHSMGGYGTWFQATRYPDRWASISPQAGYADYFLYHPAMGGPANTAQQPFQKRLLEQWSPLTFVENLLYVPAYIVHGAKDDNVPVTHSRKMAARLGELGYTYVYDENPEGGHWWGPRGQYYGMEVVDKPPIWTFFQKHDRRVRLPKRVVYTTDSLRFHEAYWVAIDELEAANQIARIEAEVTAPNAIAVKLSNITQFTLRLNNGLVCTDRPIKLSLDGHVVYDAPLPPSAHLTLRRAADGRYVQLFNETDLRISGQGVAMERFDGFAAELDEVGHVARIIARGPEPLKKTAQLYGPVIDAFTTPFLFVVGTAGRDAKAIEMQAAAQRAAKALAREWMARANGMARIKSDTDVTRDDIAAYNLILFGNAQTNRLITQINDELPLRFTATGIRAEGRVITGDDLGMVMVTPNPLNPNRYAVIVGGMTPRSFETAARLRLAELPDYVIFDRRTLAGQEIDFVGGGFFDKFWRLADPHQIGRAP